MQDARGKRKITRAGGKEVGIKIGKSKWELRVDEWTEGADGKAARDRVQHTVGGKRGSLLGVIGIYDGKTVPFESVGLDDVFLGLVDKHAVWRRRIGIRTILYDGQMSKLVTWRGNNGMHHEGQLQRGDASETIRRAKQRGKPVGRRMEKEG